MKSVQLSGFLQLALLAEMFSNGKILKKGFYSTEKETPKGWPARGRIQFKSCYMKYTPEDLPVLKNLNLVIESGWKVKIQLFTYHYAVGKRDK